MRSCLVILGIFLLSGCAARSDPIDAQTRDIVLLVPGVDGAPRGRYEPFIAALHEGGARAPVQIVQWGAPPILFFINFQTQSVHDRAERDLASRIATWKRDHPDVRIDVVAHSAGCGVALGALRKLEPGASVNNVILLAPSVSPGYDLSPPLVHIAGQLHVFHSERDTFFLSWRTGTFGTYDNIRTRAAGNQGFEQQLKRLIQHRYDPAWENLGNGGGHTDWLAPRFTGKVLAPLLIASSPS